MVEPRAFDTLEHIEKAGKDELQDLQLRRLKWSLEHAYANVGCYRKKFDEAGVHPSDLKELSDLSGFPLTDKHDFRDNYPFGMFAVPMGPGSADTRIQRYHGQACGGGLYQE